MIVEFGQWWMVWADQAEILETQDAERAAREAQRRGPGVSLEDRSTGLQWHWKGGQWTPMWHEKKPPEVITRLGPPPDVSVPPTPGPHAPRAA